MRRISFAFLMMLAISPALAADKAEAAAELTDLIANFEEVVAQRKFGISEEADRILLEYTKRLNLSVTEADTFRRIIDRTYDPIKNSVSADQLRKTHIDLLIESFTESELRELVTFWKSPINGKYQNFQRRFIYEVNAKMNARPEFEMKRAEIQVRVELEAAVKACKCPKSAFFP